MPLYKTKKPLLARRRRRVTGAYKILYICIRVRNRFVQPDGPLNEYLDILDRDVKEADVMKIRATVSMFFIFSLSLILKVTANYHCTFVRLQIKREKERFEYRFTKDVLFQGIANKRHKSYLCIFL